MRSPSVRPPSVAVLRTDQRSDEEGVNGEGEVLQDERAEEEEGDAFGDAGSQEAASPAEDAVDEEAEEDCDKLRI